MARPARRSLSLGEPCQRTNRDAEPEAQSSSIPFALRASAVPDQPVLAARFPDGAKAVPYPMSQQPLFYRSIVPLNREAHARKRIRTHPGMFGFAANNHLIPAVIDEFAAACRHLPVLFLPAGAAPTPVFLVGVRSGHNILVGADGRWEGAYIPAFVRRYPFILGEVEGSDPVVCLDEGSELVNEADGEPLFEDTKETGFLNDRIALLRNYVDAAKRTEAASRILQEMDLFTTITIDFKQGDVSSTSIHGLLAIDEQKLLQLADEQVARLHRERMLAPIYAHLLSLGSIEPLGERARARS